MTELSEPIAEAVEPVSLQAASPASGSSASEVQGGKVDELFGRPLGHLVQALYGTREEDIETALGIQKKTGAKLGDVLVEQGYISEAQLSACLAVAAKKETTFLSHAFLSPLKHHWWGRHFQLFIEALLITVISFLFVHYVVGLRNSGLIALFLFSAALTTRFNVVLADVDLKNELVDIFALFAGILVAFVGVALTIEQEVLHRVFGFILESANLSDKSTLEQRRFGQFSSVFVHNFSVFMTMGVLSFIYRAYAAVLILAWNACIWGLTLTILFKQSLGMVDASPLMYSLKALIAVLPHLTLETMAYIGGSMGSIGLSRLFLWHDFMSPRFKEESQRFLKMLGVAIFMLVLGAYVEAHWVKFVLHQF
ncbi:MAG: stage II sporulation protein M [Myxococcota bacterium]|nr:stage II sporulation protein M [Myxococcota bacterium]